MNGQNDSRNPSPSPSVGIQRFNLVILNLFRSTWSSGALRFSRVCRVRLPAQFSSVVCSNNSDRLMNLTLTIPRVLRCGPLHPLPTHSLQWSFKSQGIIIERILQFLALLSLIESQNQLMRAMRERSTNGPIAETYQRPQSMLLQILP